MTKRDPETGELVVGKDGIRVPSWIAGPLILGAITAGASGLFIARSTASDVEDIKQERVKEKAAAQDVHDRVIRIEGKVEGITDDVNDVKKEQTEQRRILDNIDRKLDRPR